MGGGDRAGTSRGKQISSITPCKICNLESHEDDCCPFMYSACPRENCKGIRKVKTSKSKPNHNRKYLACQYTKCHSFQWLDEAVGQYCRTGAFPKQHVLEGCFKCGAIDHWQNDCPWVNNPCRLEDCPGDRILKISGQKGSDGEKYLSYCECGDFQWLKDAKKEVESKVKVEAKIAIEANLSDLCHNFTKDCEM